MLMLRENFLTNLVQKLVRIVEKLLLSLEHLFRCKLDDLIHGSCGDLDDLEKLESNRCLGGLLFFGNKRKGLYEAIIDVVIRFCCWHSYLVILFNAFYLIENPERNKRK